jgi:gamma-glutamyl-gamma-aminobutyrate hydrolase PuuD
LFLPVEVESSAMVRVVRPLIGIVSDHQVIHGQKKYSCEAPAARAIFQLAAAVPVLIPALGRELDVEALLNRLDRLMVPDGLSNVDNAIRARS